MSAEDRSPLWPPATGPVAPADVSRTLDDQLERRPYDTTDAWAQWNRDRLRQRLATREEPWPLPPPVGTVNVFVLHPAGQLTPGHPLLAALKRLGYMLYAAARPGGGASSIPVCHLLVVVIDEASAPLLADGSLDDWTELLTAVRDAELPVLGAWTGGDDVPAPFEPVAVLDLRNPDGADAAVAAAFPERQVLVLGERGDGTVRVVGPRGAVDIEGIRKAVEYLDDLGEFVSIRLASGPTEVDAPDPEQVLGIDRLLDPSRPRLAARNDPQLWPELRDELARAREENARHGIEAWNRERLAAREAGRSGGARELPVVGAPRIFVSYRWESIEHEAWVDRLTGELFGRGYDVVFDRHPDEIDDPHGPDDIFFRIASSTVFLPIVTDSYVDAIEAADAEHPSWAAREWSEAMELDRQSEELGDSDDLRIVAVQRSGSRLPAGLEPDRVVDLRDDPDDFTRLDEDFPELDVSLDIAARDGRVVAGPIRRGEVDDALTAMEPAIDAGAFVDVRVWQPGDSTESDSELAYEAAVCAFNTGNARAEEGDTDGARAAYDVAMALGSGAPSTRAAFNLAALEEAVGNYPAAIASYELVLAVEDAEVQEAARDALQRLLAELRDE